MAKPVQIHVFPPTDGHEMFYGIVVLLDDGRIFDKVWDNNEACWEEQPGPWMDEDLGREAVAGGECCKPPWSEWRNIRSSNRQG